VSRKECRHDVEKVMFLNSHDTPHIDKPHTMAVKVLVFLCKDCGQPFSVFHESPKAIAFDGSITSEMLDEIKHIQNERELDRRLKEHKEAQQKEKQDV